MDGHFRSSIKPVAKLMVIRITFEDPSPILVRMTHEMVALFFGRLFIITEAARASRSPAGNGNRLDGN